VLISQGYKKVVALKESYYCIVDVRDLCVEKTFKKTFKKPRFREQNVVCKKQYIEHKDV